MDEGKVGNRTQLVLIASSNQGKVTPNSKCHWGMLESPGDHSQWRTEEDREADGWTGDHTVLSISVGLPFSSLRLALSQTAIRSTIMW